MEEYQEIMQHYPVGRIMTATPGGGTAGKTWRISTEKGPFLLRRRGGRTSAPDLIERDHRLREFLLANGLPTTLPEPTSSGMRYLLTPAGAAYELHPLIVGHFIRPDRPEELAALARTLARFHRLTREFRNSLPVLTVDQFGNAVPGARRSTRLDDPAAILSALELLAVSFGDREKFRQVRQLAEQLAGTYTPERYRETDRFVTHGDLNFSNVLFGDDGGVAGLFDFDWTMPGDRIRDLADALHFFAGTMPPDADCGNIWDLTQMPRFSRPRGELFLRHYEQEFPLTGLELELLPAAHTARVLAFHIEGTAKVPPERRAEFLERAAALPRYRQHFCFL